MHVLYDSNEIFCWVQQVNGVEHVVCWPKNGCQDALNTGLQLYIACYATWLHAQAENAATLLQK